MAYPAWGKTDNFDTAWHHLAHHCMDVAAVFQRLLELPVLRVRAEKALGCRLLQRTIVRLSAIVFLHDIGKLHPGFQAKGWPKETWQGPPCGHVAASIPFLQLAGQCQDHPFHNIAEHFSAWGPGIECLILASLSHHGRPISPGNPAFIKDWDRPSIQHYEWRSEAEVMATALRTWFPDAFQVGPPLTYERRFVHFFAGMVALADWVGSDKRFFHFSREFDSSYDRHAQERASKALATIGIDTEGLPRLNSPSFFQVSGFRCPNPAQSAVGKADTKQQLIILEAATGSGKTEAALWRFAQLFAEGCVDGLYFAVPTRAAARQLHDRVNKAMKRLFGSQAPEAVLAIPGMLKAGETTGHRLPHWKVLWDDGENSFPARWAAEHAMRFLCATVAVGTIDQAMLAGLMVKHAHLRGTALSRSLLVIDEVHASDAYMTAIVTHLLKDHREIGGYAMLMSATLGSRARIRWTGEPRPDLNTAVSTDYPAVWLGNSPVPLQARGARTKVVELALDGMEPSRAAELALGAARKGARVLVVRNTVARAVETWRAVQERGGSKKLLEVASGPALHHGRFAAEDRELLDRAVERILAPDPKRAQHGMVIIGTQTLEQSLDIDADYLIADLCPIDVLLQRIGRLHRHELPRPEGYETARCVVLIPERGLDRLTEPAFDNGLGGWNGKHGFQGVYQDLSVLELTRRLLQQGIDWCIPEMNRELVESATHPDAVASLLEEKGNTWKEYDLKLGGTIGAQNAFAQLNRLDRSKPYGEPFPQSDERIVTRLGEEGVVLTFDSSPIGPFGGEISRLTLPAHLSYGISEAEIDADNVAATPDGLVFTVSGSEFRYTREGLDKISNCAAKRGMLA